MKVLLANPRGFCAGVNMAIECLDLAVEKFGGESIFVYHEIVHNRHVVDRFTELGVTFVDEVSDVPHGAILLYSAHGVSPQIRELSKERELHTIDATCPLVTKVHIEALRFAREGYHILLIGHEGHDEVIGTMGEAPESITLVEDVSDVDNLTFGPDAKLAYLTQTTLSVEDANQVIHRLQERYPQIEGPPKDDICYATTNRQEAVSSLAPQADVVLVLGSQNSSNSLRLRDLGEACGARAFLIDGVDEVDPEWLESAQTVLVTAGASAPEELVQGCLQHLKTTYGGQIEEVSLREEHVRFPLPRELRVLSD